MSENVEYIFFAEEAKLVENEYKCCAKMRVNHELDEKQYFIKFQDGIILNPYKRLTFNNSRYDMRKVNEEQFFRYINFLKEKKEHQINRLGREL